MHDGIERYSHPVHRGRDLETAHYCPGQPSHHAAANRINMTVLSFLAPMLP